MLEQLQLSSAQHGIWLGQQLNSASPVYNTAEYIEITGSIQEQAFKDTVSQVLDEAQALRVNIVEQSSGLMQVIQPLESWILEVIDLSEQACPHTTAELWMQDDLKKAVNVASEPLFCQALFKLAEDKYYWYQRIHHAVIDGYGFSLLSKRVAEVYTGLVTNTSPVSKPLGALSSVIEEDNAYRHSPSFLQDKLFWQSRMADMSRVATLTTQTEPFSPTFIRQSKRVDQSYVRGIEALAKQLNVSWADVLIAGLALLVNKQKRSNEDNIVLGLPVMNRLGSASLRVPCMQMNIIPIRLEIKPDNTLVDVIKRVKSEMNITRKHQKYRYEDIRRDMSLLGGNKRLFGPVINIMPFEKELYFGDFLGITHNLSAGPVEDISIGILGNTNSELYINFDANPACYTNETLGEQLSLYLSLLNKLLDNPYSRVLDNNCLPDYYVGEQKIVSQQYVVDTKSNVVVNLLDGGENPKTVTTVIEQFSEKAKLYRNKPAIEHNGLRLSYQALHNNAQIIARHIKNKTAKHNPLVAILLPRSLDAISTILATLVAGAGYIPLDPEGPESRNTIILEDSQPDLIITYSTYKQAIWDQAQHIIFIDQLQANKPSDEANKELILTPGVCSSVAYVIYTSGSTGKPNGVSISHGALANFVTAASTCYGVDHQDRILQFAPLHFDASVEEIFLSLCNGGTLVLRTDEMLNSIPHFLSDCHANNITVLDLPTAFWHELTLAATKDNLPSRLKTIIIGGEAVQPERLAQWQKKVGKDIKLLNTYGPTETTVVATYADISNVNLANEQLTIGKPLPGVQAVILNDQLQPTANEGELCLLGKGLATHYLNRPELNTQRFVSLDNLPGKPRGYRTGDRVKLTANEDIVYLGRIDEEFKISGYRINPIEIENILIKHNVIKNSAVIGQVLENGGKRLVAFIVIDPQKNHSITPELIRKLLIKEIPPAVVPSVIKIVSQLPKTASGKIDRKQLKHLHLVNDKNEEEVIITTPLERQILTIWSEVLGHTALRPQNDFFKLGGQSLQTIQVANRLSLVLGREVAVMDLFKHPIAADLAIALESDSSEAIINNYELKSNNHEIMMMEDALLGYDIVPNSVKNITIQSNPKNVLLTGVTGFVGAQLLHKLLINTSTNVYCLVRTADKQQAIKRIGKALSNQHLIIKDLENRIFPVISDLSKPQLGLTDDEFNYLANECDAIYHNGAVVSIVREYSSLREVNVLATQTLLKLAAAKRAVPFHHISTQAVAAPTSVMDELPETFINKHEGLLDGYQQSKWVAEHLVQQAGERGLPITLYRLGRVTGSSDSGFVNEQDFFWRIVQASLPIKAFPNINIEEVWTPVDYVAEAISRISLTQSLQPKVLNIAVEETVLLLNLFQWIREFGFAIEPMSLPQWKAKVEAQSREQDLATMAFFDMRAASVDNNPKENAIKNHVVSEKFKKFAKQIKLSQPEINKDLLFKYLKYAINRNLIPSTESI